MHGRLYVEALRGHRGAEPVRTRDLKVLHFICRADQVAQGKAGDIDDLAVDFHADARHLARRAALVQDRRGIRSNPHERPGHERSPPYH